MKYFSYQKKNDFLEKKSHLFSFIYFFFHERGTEINDNPTISPPTNNPSSIYCKSKFDEDGGIAVYVLVVLYIILGVGIICEENFKSTILAICQKLKVKKKIRKKINSIFFL